MRTLQVNGHINKLEANLNLTDDESQNLIYEIDNCLRKR